MSLLKRELLAKSDGTTLEEHTRDVENAAQVLFRLLLSAPDLTRAAWLHDLGKAAHFFQIAIHGGKHNGMRHELFSFIWAVSLKDNLKMSDEELAAILSHHRQLWVTPKNISKNEIAVWCSDSDELAQSVADLKELIQGQLREYQLEIEELFGAFPTLRPKYAAQKMRDLRTLCEQNSVWTPQGNILMLYRGALVGSDHLASAELGVALSGSNIFARRMRNTVAGELKKRRKESGYYIRPWKGWSWIQRKCAHTMGNALLVAPTGAGKTEAALLWVLNNRKGAERIFFVLPYQVSINAMARRLAQLFPDDNNKTEVGENTNVAVVHSNADLAYLQESLRDDVSFQEASKIARANKNAARQLYAPLKVTTVYQLLNLFFGRKFFEVGLLELSGSLVVFDEIHAYDGHTLGLILVLLDCLHKLGARVFIMTATLPDALKTQLREAAHIPIGAEIRLPDDDPLQRQARRQILLHDGLIEDREVIDQIGAAIQSGKRVAVVCNSVRKAIQVSRFLSEYQPYLVHSRFTLGDRAKRERKEIIEKQRLVIATQVLEVSLDVSFDAMWSELAPADALLQRMGRVNRHGNGEFSSPVTICCGEDAPSLNVYDAELLKLTEQWARMAFASKRKLDFPATLDWMQFVYPNGLTDKENQAMETAKNGFKAVVDSLKPMIDPSIDPDLELTLFETVQVVPGRLESEFRNAVLAKEFLRAKQMIVNVNRKSWLGAVHKAQFAGLDEPKKVSDLGDDWNVWLALFRYTNSSKPDEDCLGLDLDDPCDERECFG